MPNKTVLLFAIFILLLITIYLQNKQIESFKTQLSAIKIESKIAIDRVEQANRDAAIEMKQSQLNSREILLAKVPSDCPLAIKWAVEQARTFRA